MESAEPRARTRQTYLVVDARERAVIPFLEDGLREHAHVVRQVNTGDYLLCQPPRGAGEGPRIRACVERKTLEDFAASFKDGRHGNVRKMLDLRAQTGCQLFYFVEGPAFPAPGRRFARVPHANIVAAQTNFMVRHGIFVVLTEDERHTAQRLGEFLRAYDAPEAGAEPPGGPRPEAAGPEGSEDPEPRRAEGAGGEPGAELAVPEVLLARIEEPDADAAVNMWARLRGISVVLGKILTREFSVADLAGRKVDEARLRALKTATGRRVNKDALAGLLALRADSHDHAVKILSGLRNITPAAAAAILDGAGGSLARLCGLPTAVIAMTPLAQKNRTVRLGQKRAARVRFFLHYCEGRAGPDEAPGRVVGRAGPGEAPGAALSAAPGRASLGEQVRAGLDSPRLAPPLPASPGPPPPSPAAAKKAPPPLLDSELDDLLAGFG